MEIRDEVRTLLEEAERARSAWAAQPVRRRLEVIRRLRRALAADPAPFEAELMRPGAGSEAEPLASQILPLVESCRFVEREAEEILAPRHPSRRSRPRWMGRVDLEVRREPLGTVLVIGPSNYPLFLPGVQALQALAAGNAVLVKPGEGGRRTMDLLADLLREAGLPRGLLGVLPEEPQAAREAIDLGVNKVVMTGSARSGQQVLSMLAPRLVPAAMELSGSDPVLVLEGADLDHLVRALTFGLRLNGSATCIAPRRIFVHSSLKAPLEQALSEAVREMPAVPVPRETVHFLTGLVRQAVGEGARLLSARPMRADRMSPLVLSDTRPGMRLLLEEVFAPVVAIVPVESLDEALEGAARSPYALGASIFGPEERAREAAGRVRAGSVTINDLIVPTADPRLPFGGRDRSGYGVTRGEEGLLEMTVPKAVTVQHTLRPRHLERPQEGDAKILRGTLALLHGGSLAVRWEGLKTITRGILQRTPRSRAGLKEARA